MNESVFGVKSRRNISIQHRVVSDGRREGRLHVSSMRNRSFSFPFTVPRGTRHGSYRQFRPYCSLFLDLYFVVETIST